MPSLNYLWRVRIKFKITDKAFFIAWAKRILSFPELVRRNKTRSKLIKQGATIHPTSEIGLVNVMGHKNHLIIGSNCFLGLISISLFDTVYIGNNVCINDGVQLLTGSHNISDPGWTHTKFKIVIDDFVWIATNAIILPGVHIGRGAVIGAGAVVSKNVKAGTIVVGNPARILSKVRCETLNYNPCEFLAVNRAWLKG